MKSVRWAAVIAFLLIFGGAPATRMLAQDHGAARPQEHKFTDQDRKAVQDYHTQHAAHPAVGFRKQDRLAPADDARIRSGIVLDAGLRKHAHPAPAELVGRLGPLPRGYRYEVVGGHVCEVDPGWHIVDVINITL